MQTACKYTTKTSVFERGIARRFWVDPKTDTILSRKGKQIFTENIRLAIQ